MLCFFECLIKALEDFDWMLRTGSVLMLLTHKVKTHLRCVCYSDSTAHVQPLTRGNDA